MKITLESYGNKYTYETGANDQTANELKEIFSKMLVQAGFSPNVIEPAEGGHWEGEYKEAE